MVAQGKYNWQQPEHSKCMSECNKDMVVRGKHPGQKQLDKIYRESKSTCWIDLSRWDHTHATPDWEEKKTNKQKKMKLPSGKTKCKFYKKEDFEDEV